MAGPLLEGVASALGRGFGAGRDGRQLEGDRREIARPAIQADAAQLRREAGELQIRVGAQMDIRAEHAGADQGNFDFSVHWFLRGDSLTSANAGKEKKRGQGY